MKVRDVPLMVAVRDAIAPLLPVLLDGFEAGIDYARRQDQYFREAFDNESLQYDPWFFSHCVRIYVKRFLTRQGYRVEDYRVDNLAMSGLRFISDDWDMRTRKSTRQGEIPRLGKSQPIRAHCQSMLPGEFGLAPQRSLWLLWHTSTANEFAGLSVVYLIDESSVQPKGIGRIDFPAQTSLFRNPAERERDLDVVGNLDMEVIPLAGELDMEMTEQEPSNDSTSEQAE